MKRSVIKNKPARIIEVNENYSKQWYIHQSAGAAVVAMDKTADAAAIKKSRLQSAPVTLLDMVF